MSHVQHSDETHAELLARIPTATGRDVASWMSAVEDGPTLLRFEERVNWMRSEHDLPLGYAHAIVHEYDLSRAARRSG
jgi:hypothetical protein